MLKAKQITKLIDAPVRIAGVSATGSSVNITTQITSALSSSGDGGVSVPVQVATASTIGIIAGDGTPLPIRDSTTKLVLTDASGNEVYGKLTSSSGTYTLSFYSLIGGTETTYSFASSQNIDFEFLYKFDFYRLPSSFSLSRNVYSDPLGSNNPGKVFTEVLTVTALNTVSNLTKTPTTNNNVHLFVNHAVHSAIASHFTISGKAITWSVANSGFNLETSDTVVATYTTSE